MTPYDIGFRAGLEKRAALSDDQAIAAAIDTVIKQERDPEQSWYKQLLANEDQHPAQPRRWWQPKPLPKYTPTQAQVEALLKEILSDPGNVMRLEDGSVGEVYGQPRTAAQGELLDRLYGGHRPFVGFVGDKPTGLGWDG